METDTQVTSLDKVTAYFPTSTHQTVHTSMKPTHYACPITLPHTTQANTRCYMHIGYVYLFAVASNAGAWTMLVIQLLAQLALLEVYCACVLLLQVSKYMQMQAMRKVAAALSSLTCFGYIVSIVIDAPRMCYTI